MNTGSPDGPIRAGGAPDTGPTHPTGRCRLARFRRLLASVIGDARGQSALLGLVLLLGMSIAGAGVIAVIGGTALLEGQQAATASSAEHELTQLDSRASLVAHGRTPSQTVDLRGSSDAHRYVDADRGWLNVTVVNATTGGVDAVVMNVTLGAIVSEGAGTTVAYQGGGVWRTSGAGSVMVSPPEFHYRGDTLTLPLVLVRGDDTLDDRARIVAGGPTTSTYPNASRGLSNPLEAGKVTVTVHSEFYEAWGRYFAHRTDGQVDVDHDARTVTLTLVSPTTLAPVSNAVAGTATGEELTLSGSGSFPAFADSYNSSDGDYAATKSTNGTLRMAGDVSVGGNGRVEGDVRSGGAVTLSGNSEVTGTVHYTTGTSINPNADYGGLVQIDGVESVDSVEGLVSAKVSTLQGDNDNDNDATAAIDGDTLNLSGGTATLSASDGTAYFLSEVDLDGERLTVETGGAEVEIAVAEDVSLEDGANITVEGGGVVRMYVPEDVTVGTHASTYVAGDRSKHLWLYGTSETDVVVQGDQSGPARLVGVVYAPDTGSTIEVRHGEVFGGAVVGSVSLETGGSIHFDRSLAQTSPLPGVASIPRLTYLHVSTNPVAVRGG